MEGYKFEVNDNIFNLVADQPELYNSLIEFKEFTEGRIFGEDDLEGMERIHEILLKMCRIVLKDENFDPAEALEEIRSKYEAERKSKNNRNKKSKQNKKKVNKKTRYGK